MKMLLSELSARLRSLVSDVTLRCRSVFSALTGRPEDRDLTAEIRFHIEKQIEKNVAAGMRPEEARRQAHIKFGGVERMRERTRETRGIGATDTLIREITQAPTRL